MKSDRLTVALNGVTVIEDAKLPQVPARGKLELQHHGDYRDGRYLGPPSLVQFRNIRVKSLDAVEAKSPDAGEAKPEVP